MSPSDSPTDDDDTYHCRSCGHVSFTDVAVGDSLDPSIYGACTHCGLLFQHPIGDAAYVALTMGFRFLSEEAAAYLMGSGAAGL
jgi:hypothetical protein